MTPEIIGQVALLTQRMGPKVAERVAKQLLELDPSRWQLSRVKMLGWAQTSQTRLLLDQLFSQCLAQEIPLPALGFAFATATEVFKDQTQKQRVELVWSGPESRKPPARLTEQAMMEVIQSAQEHLLIVSYTVHRIQILQTALLAALDRGVRLTLVFDDLGKVGDMTKDAMKDLARHSESFRHIYTWPRESGNGKPIVNLHVKCMVADRDVLLLGSANLTQAAMERNMELGILLHGGPHPGHIRDHFQWLIRDAVLVPRVVGSAKLRDA